MQVMQIRQVTHVVASPDGEHLAYTVSVPRGPDDDPGAARTDVFVVAVAAAAAPAAAAAAAAGEPQQIVSGATSVNDVSFDPRGGLVTYLKKGEDDDHREVWGTPVRGSGGDTSERRLTHTPLGIDHYAWRPDGAALAYTVEDPPPAARAEARAMGFGQRVVDEDFDHVSLWLWDRETGRSRRLTQGMTVFSFEWSPDGRRLAAAIARRNLVDDRYMFTRLFVVDPETGTVEPLVDNPGKLGDYSWSPDGETLAYVSAADRRDPHAGMLFTVRPGEQEPRPQIPDLAGMVHQVDWLDDATLRFVVSTGVRSSVMRTGLGSNRASFVVPVDAPAYREVAPLGDGRFAMAASTPRHPDEVFVFAPGRGFKRRTDHNPWLAEVALGRQEVVSFAARDGVQIEGLLIKPVGFADGGTPYPLVIVAHGGPESHYSNGWLTRYAEPGQVLAARGFLVWYPNYRASTGYGVAFAKADHGDPMGSEFDDHVDAIAHLSELGLADPERVGIIGGSYGGYTAAWAATRATRHFAAAVSFVPFVDIRTKWYTSDIPFEFHLVHYEEKWPHEQPGLLADRSPLTWAAQCRTPLLLLGGTSDPRVHPSQPHMLYRAVRTATDTPCRYVQYPGEGHGNRTNVYQYDYMLRGIRWLTHYLSAPDRRRAEPPPLDLDYGAWRRSD